MECKFKHCKVQIPDEDWRCPKCDSENFTIEFYDGGPDPDCPELHDVDVCVCWDCDHSTSGKTLSKNYAKKKNLVPCPHCKGKGFVKGA